MERDMENYKKWWKEWYKKDRVRNPEKWKRYGKANNKRAKDKRAEETKKERELRLIETKEYLQKLTPEKKEERKKKKKEYNKRNAEKISLQRKEYWQKNKEQIKEQRVGYRQRTKKERSDWAKEYRKRPENLERIMKYAREHQDKKERRPGATAWSFLVKKRENFTCQACGKHGGELRSHHIFPWAAFSSIRLDLKNGICLCKKCHNKFHFLHGKSKYLDNWMVI